MQSFRPHLNSHALAWLVLASVAGCGGHHHDSGNAADNPAPGTPTAPAPADNDPSAPAPVPPVPTTLFSMRVIDDNIAGATVCSDLNNNDAIDPGEPCAISGADGIALVPLTNEQRALCAPWIAIVASGATDAGSGVVTTPYKMGAPCNTPGLITPMTSLVQIYMEVFGLDQATAGKAIARLFEARGLSVDPLADFTATEEERNKLAHDVARVLVLIKQEMVRVAGNDGGKRDAIDNTLVALLGDAIDLVRTPAVREAATPAARLDALRQGAADIVLAAGLSAESIFNIIAEFNKPATPPAPEATERSLQFLNFTSRTIYDYGVHVQTAAQRLADGTGLEHFTDGRRRSHEIRTQTSDGMLQIHTQTDTWGVNYQRNLMFWNGSQWNYCAEDQIHDRTPPDADGKVRVNYCNADLYESTAVPFDFSGLSYKSLHKFLAQVTSRIPRPAHSGFFPPQITWPEDAIPANAVLPKGAKVSIEIVEQNSAPLSYSTVDLPTILPRLPASCALGVEVLRKAQSIEDLLAVDGTRCADGPLAGRWDYAVLRLTPDNNGLAGNSLSVSFRNDGTNRVFFWRCDAASNCLVEKQGNYRLETINAQGDRVLSFFGLPGEVLGSAFVQRGNSVYYGTRVEEFGTWNYPQLNPVATEALLRELGPSYFPAPEQPF